MLVGTQGWSGRPKLQVCLGDVAAESCEGAQPSLLPALPAPGPCHSPRGPTCGQTKTLRVEHPPRHQGITCAHVCLPERVHVHTCGPSGTVTGDGTTGHSPQLHRQHFQRASAHRAAAPAGRRASCHAPPGPSAAAPPPRASWPHVPLRPTCHRPAPLYRLLLHVPPPEAYSPSSPRATFPPTCRLSGPTCLSVPPPRPTRRLPAPHMHPRSHSRTFLEIAFAAEERRLVLCTAVALFSM